MLWLVFLNHLHHLHQIIMIIIKTSKSFASTPSSTILLTLSLLKTHRPFAIATTFVPCRLWCRQIFIIHMWRNIRVVLVSTHFGSTSNNFFLWVFPSSFELCVLCDTKFISETTDKSMDSILCERCSTKLGFWRAFSKKFNNFTWYRLIIAAKNLST